MNPYPSFQLPDALKPFLSEPEAAQTMRRHWLHGCERVQESWLRSTRGLFAHCDAMLREGQTLQDSMLAQYFEWVKGWTGTPVGAKPTAPVKPATAATVEPVAPVKTPPSEDDLTLIQGVGKVVQHRLNKVGVISFEQVAAWSDTEIAYIENNVLGSRFSGRVSREGWQTQAKALMKKD